MAANIELEIMTVENVRLIDIPKIHDEKGNLSVVEGRTIPFEIKRVYFLYDVPSHAKRGGHAQITENKILVALSGSFEVVVNDGQDEKVFKLNKPNLGVFIPNGIWREIRNFSAGSVCLAISSTDFDESDYIREFETFKSSKN